MFESIAYIPGYSSVGTPLLSRYQPMLNKGIANQWLHENCKPGDWILDPFGSSSDLLIEIAQAGYRVLATINNPIDRFLLEFRLSHPSEETLKASLAELADFLIGNERLELHIRSLYKTYCTKCNSEIEADYFIWSKEDEIPISKSFSCQNCGTEGEYPTSQGDIEKAKQIPSRSLHYFRALERVAPIRDPHRPLVEEALQSYTPRAIFALITIINKLDSISPNLRTPLTALVLSALDEANSLWSHPSSRARPLQFSIPPRYREKNVWKALEDAVYALGGFFKNDNGNHEEISLISWPQLPEQNSGICIFEGRLRDFVHQFKTNIRFSAVLTAFPRPNQAYWTLSTLWSGWLWGRETASSMKSVIRRRRFGRAWYASALQLIMQAVSELCKPGTPLLGLITEIDPGFITASLIALRISSFRYQGIAFNPDRSCVQLQFTKTAPSNQVQHNQQISLNSSTNLILDQEKNFLKKMGEPCSYSLIYTIGVLSLLYHQDFISQQNHNSTSWFQSINQEVKSTLENQSEIKPYSSQSKTAELGLWWFAPRYAKNLNEHLSLSDRVEMEIYQFLSTRKRTQLRVVDSQVCKKFKGLFTPSFELVKTCLESYTETEDQDTLNRYLRQTDYQENRKKDILELESAIVKLGEKFGYTNAAIDSTIQLLSPYPSSQISWLEPSGNKLKYIFFVISTAILQEIITWQNAKDTAKGLNEKPSNYHKIVILPGSRANLLLLKQRKNPVLQQIFNEDWKFVKFRHFRHLTSIGGITEDIFLEQLELDPLTNIDPQLKLL